MVAAGGIITVCLLYFLGRTTEPKKPIPVSKQESAVPAFDIQRFITESHKNLSPSQTLYVSELENTVKRGDVHAQQINAYNSLAAFWKDSVPVFEPYAFYISEAAKLDNSEKNLTFAAQLFLERLRGEHDLSKLDWETATAVELFEKAIALNPDNDDLKIGLGSCYIFGKGRNGDPQETMKGIQQLLSVARKDSTNMKAQMMLGVGGYISGQYDKAIDRLLKVVNAQPDNVEAVAFLADTYAAAGKKAEAIKWYNISKRLINNPAYSKEVDQRISQLQ